MRLIYFEKGGQSSLISQNLSRDNVPQIKFCTQSKEEKKKQSVISYRTQVISGRDVEEIIFCSVTVGRGRFLSRWDNRNLQRRFLLLIKELQRHISHGAPAAGGGRSCTLFWCSRCLFFFLICDLPEKEKKKLKKNSFFNFPDRSLLHRTRHINNCKVNEMWTGCILMMFFGLFWLCKRNFSVLISRTALHHEDRTKSTLQTMDGGRLTSGVGACVGALTCHLR